MTSAASRIGRLLAEGREAGVFSAAACQVGAADGPVHTTAVGTLTWDGQPAAAETPFDVASVTKPIVGLLAMVLLEAGELALDDEVGQVLSEFRATDKAELTVGQLLTHTAGIPGQVPLYRSAPDADRLRAAVRELPLVAAPGTHVAYTSQGFMILGWLLAEVAGESLEDALRRYVLEPLAMTETRFGLPPQLRDRAAATERCPWRGRLVQGTVHDENAEVLGGCAGHAGLFSSVADLGALCREMLRAGTGDRSSWLGARTVRVMTAAHTDRLNLRRCLAWQGRDPVGCPAGDLVSSASYGHTGFTGTSVWIDPVLDLYVVLLTNAVHPDRDPPRIGAFRRRFHNGAIAAALSSRAEE